MLLQVSFRDISLCGAAKIEQKPLETVFRLPTVWMRSRNSHAHKLRNEPIIYGQATTEVSEMLDRSHARKCGTDSTKKHETHPVKVS